jgi:hypothetical protein
MNPFVVEGIVHFAKKFLESLTFIQSGIMLLKWTPELRHRVKVKSMTERGSQ